MAGLIVATVVTLLSVGLSASAFLDNIQLKLSHSLYGEREVAEQIVIVAIDDQSMLTGSLGGLGELGEWPRSYYANVIEAIEAGSPASVMLDVHFPDHADGISSEQIYETSVAYPSVNAFVGEILNYASVPHPEDAAMAETLAAYDNIYLVKSYAGEVELVENVFQYEASIEQYTLFTENAHDGWGNIIDAEASANLSAIYKIPVAFSKDGVVEEHIDVQLAETYLGTEIEIPVEEGQMLINYAKPAYGYPMFSFVDVLNGSVDASEFENKIVLIGATAAILQDTWITPIDESTLMPGVEIHANAIQTILDEAYLKNQTAGALLMLLAVMVTVSVMAFLYLPMWAGGAVLVAQLLAFPFYAQWRFGQGVILELIWPVFALVTAYLAVLAYRNVTEFAEKRKLKTAFGHYVSPELVEQISANPDMLKLGGERRVMTTLFLDIENFTTLSESLEPQAVVSIINTYFDALAGVIMAHGGTVDKFEGDAIMALFGAPVPSEDHGLQACKAAIALRQKMQELNEQTGSGLNIRIGIATGESIVGNMGSQQRFDYTAMGDTVNTASRLEGGNKFYGTRILVNPGTCKAAQDHIVFRRVDRVRLKGKEEAIDIYEVMGMKEGLSEGGAVVLNEWHQALEYYRNQQWDEVEQRLQALAEKMPGDGPIQTYLKRVAQLKLQPREGWDGTWTFDQK